MPRKVQVEVSITIMDKDYDVTVEYTPGTPDRGPDMNCAGGYPGDPPEYEIIRVVESEPGPNGGLVYTPAIIDTIERDPKLMGRLEDAVLDQLSRMQPDDGDY